MEDWKTIQALLAEEAIRSSSADASVGLAIYYYLLHQQQTGLAEQAQARKLFEAHLTALLASADVPDAGRAIGLAWLHAQLMPAAEADQRMAILDTRLLARALELAAMGATDTDAPELWRLVRYLTGRLAAPAVQRGLHQLLAALYPTEAALARPLPAGSAIPLSTPDSLTWQILLLTDIGAAGIQLPLVQQRVRHLVATLLAAKHEIDFSEGRYSLFPDATAEGVGGLTFSNHLSWARSADLAAAQALYQAHHLLHDAELGRIAELIGLNTLLRLDAAATQVRGAQFEQGAFGVAYAYARLFLLSQNPAYQRYYAYWHAQGLQWLQQELAAGHYRTLPADSLDGSLGIGLMLQLAAAPQQASYYAAAIEACYAGAPTELVSR